MATLFIKELELQLRLIEEAMQEIRNRGFTDVWGPHIKAGDKQEYRALAEKRRQIRNQIINYKMP